MAPCPLDVAKSWHLGMARRTAAEARKHSVARVASSLPQTQYVFLEQPPGWQEIPWSAMSEAEQAEANEAWRQAEVASVPSGEGSSRGSTIQLMYFELGVVSSSRREKT